MKQKYVLTAVAVVAVGAVALGTVPMWEGTNSVKQEETRGTGKYRNRSNRYANASSDDGPGYWNFSYGQL